MAVRCGSAVVTARAGGAARIARQLMAAHTRRWRVRESKRGAWQRREVSNTADGGGHDDCADDSNEAAGVGEGSDSAVASA